MRLWLCVRAYAYGITFQMSTVVYTRRLVTECVCAGPVVWAHACRRVSEGCCSCEASLHLLGLRAISCRVRDAQAGCLGVCTGLMLLFTINLHRCGTSAFSTVCVDSKHDPHVLSTHGIGC